MEAGFDAGAVIKAISGNIKGGGGGKAAMAQAGVAFATEQIVDLVANGVQHIHVYTMNKPWIARAIRDNLSEVFGHDAL